MTQTEKVDEAGRAAQDELKRAYMQVSFGQFDEAIASCERAAQLLPDHHLPSTLKGSFELAAGRVRQALGTLRRATRRHNDQPLPLIYFAEACFLGGRQRQASRALQKAQKMQHDAEVGALIEQLRQTWDEVEAEEMPPPLVVELDPQGPG